MGFICVLSIVIIYGYVLRIIWLRLARNPSQKKINIIWSLSVLMVSLFVFFLTYVIYVSYFPYTHDADKSSFFIPSSGKYFITISHFAEDDSKATKLYIIKKAHPKNMKIIKNNYDLISLMKEMNINVDNQQIKREISDLKRMLQQVKQDVPFEKVKTSEFKQSAIMSAGYVPDYVYIMVGIFSLIYWLLGIVFIKGRLRGDLSSSKEMVDSR
jgi:hypothetical protein